MATSQVFTSHTRLMAPQQTTWVKEVNVTSLWERVSPGYAKSGGRPPLSPFHPQARCPPAQAFRASQAKPLVFQHLALKQAQGCTFPAALTQPSLSYWLFLKTNKQGRLIPEIFQRTHAALCKTESLVIYSAETPSPFYLPHLPWGCTPQSLLPR